jgi:hypothetical protein
VIGLSPAAASLDGGTYTNTVWFTNLNDGVTQSRGFNLTVFSMQLVQNGNFETHSFTGWTETGTALAIEGMLVTSNARFVESGKYGAALGSQYTLGYISQTLQTSPGQLYFLSFWLSSTDGLVPNQFLATWNGTTLFNQSNLPKFGWTNLTYALAAQSSSTVLQFGCLDQPSFLGLDNVSVLPILPPEFQSVSRASGKFVCNWFALPGLAYQVQFKTNLSQRTWANLGNVVTTTNSMGSASDSSSDPVRFYRIVISP